MCCKNLWKRIGSFSLTLFLGLSATKSFQQEINVNKSLQVIKISTGSVNIETGTGESGKPNSSERLCFACKDGKEIIPFTEEKTFKTSVAERKGVELTSKPRPIYTDAARQNQIEGIVRLRISFTASGSIGSISTISGLSDGLTEQAILAAKQIEFKPATRNGNPIDSVRVIEYNFAIR